MPLELTVVDGAGAASVHEVHAGEPAVVSVPVNGYLAPDENELSAAWNSTYNVSDDVFRGQFISLLAPFAPEALTALESRSTAHQELALANFGLPVFDPAGFAAFYAGLDSPLSRRSAEIGVCFNARDATTGAAWRALIPVFLAHPGIESFSFAFSGCPAPQAAIDELAQIVAAPTPANARRLSYLLNFDYGEASIDQIGSVAVTAPSLQLREQALNRLAAQLNGRAGYSPVVNLAPWRALFRDQLAHAETAIRFNIVWNASRLAPKDVGALPIVADRLHIYALTNDARRRVVCQASDVAIGDDAAWQSFRAALHRDALPATVLEVADNPAACAPGLRALSQEPERVLSKPL
jgi:hypothetical protein